MLACIGGFKQLESIDRRHWGLQVVPEEVYRHERTLEELNLDFNAIQELPPVRKGSGTQIWLPSAHGWDCFLCRPPTLLCLV